MTAPNKTHPTMGPLSVSTSMNLTAGVATRGSVGVSMCMWGRQQVYACLDPADDPADGVITLVIALFCAITTTRSVQRIRMCRASRQRLKKKVCTSTGYYCRWWVRTTACKHHSRRWGVPAIVPASPSPMSCQSTSPPWLSRDGKGPVRRHDHTAALTPHAALGCCTRAVAAVLVLKCRPWPWTCCAVGQAHVVGVPAAHCPDAARAHTHACLLRTPTLCRGVCPGQSGKRYAGVG